MKKTIDLSAVLRDISQEIMPLLGQGTVAQYIPALAKVEPKQFAMSICLTNGQTFNVGASNKPFSIQSISKVFTYTLALKAYKKELFKRVWREPSGDPFNSLVQLEYEEGIPRNPFINAGAIVVSDSLISHFKDHKNATNEILNFIRECSNDDSIQIDSIVSGSEMNHGHRNIAMTNLMKSFGNIDNNVTEVLQTYFNHCSIDMSVCQLARSMLYLANNGTDPLSGKEFITAGQAKRINAIMLTCGHYDASGNFAFKVGLPGKSGVGGGIVAIVPGKMSIAVYSPALNEHGNSLVGTKALELFTTKTGLSIF